LVGLLSRNNKSTRYAANLQTTQTPDSVIALKIRDAESRQVKNKAVYVALGVTEEGDREVLGLWPYGEFRYSPIG
jgi:hypothetical protein